MLDLLEELNEVAGALEGASIPFALVGGLAYSLYVQPRATIDIDLLVKGSDWERIPSVLAPLGFLQLAEPMDFEKIRIRRLTKLAGADYLILDFLLTDERSRPALEAPNLLPLRGRLIPVAPIPVLISLKQDRMSPQDQVDIAGLEDRLRSIDSADA